MIDRERRKFRSRASVAVRQLAFVRRVAVVAFVAVALAAGCGSDAETVRANWTAEGADPSSDSLSITVSVGSSSCNELGEVRVKEGPAEVVIEAYVRTERGGDCTADCSTERHRVALDRPLGDRRLRGGDVRTGC